MEKILMGGIVGFTLLTLISYLLIVANVPFLIIPITLLAIVFVAKPLVKVLKEIKIKFDKTTILTLLVFVVGIIGQMLVISPSGILKNGDLVFWSAHGHDASWHIALMEEIKKGYPFQNPVFAGEKLINYHFFSDIAPAIISKYLPISDLDYISEYFLLSTHFFWVLLYTFSPKKSRAAASPVSGLLFLPISPEASDILLARAKVFFGLPNHKVQAETRLK